MLILPFRGLIQKTPTTVIGQSIVVHRISQPSFLSVMAYFFYETHNALDVSSLYASKKI
jgi:hypothetical protein